MYEQLKIEYGSFKRIPQGPERKTLLEKVYNSGGRGDLSGLCGKSDVFIC
jgi:hypothetical protein